MKSKQSLQLITGILFSIIILASATNAATARDGFGLGVIIGEPTGPSFKVWTGNSTAIDGAVAWSFEGNNDLQLHMDYLFHEFGAAKVSKGSLPFYYGIGGRVRFREGNRDDEIGVRIPAGMSYLFANSPVELFFEIVPIVNLAPDTELDFNGGIGIRYYFGK